MTEPIDTRKRHKTRYPGIYYRLTADGERRYVIWYRDSNQKARFKTLPRGTTEREAVKAKASLSTRIAAGERVAPSKLTISEWSELWIEEVRPRIKDKTYTSWHWAIAKHIRPRIGTIRVHELTVDDVARLVSDMQAKDYKAWTIRGVLTPLSRMMAVAARRGMCNANPVSKLDRSERPRGDQKEMRILDEKEIQQLISAASSNRWKALFSTLIFSGLRISEALALEWKDVSLKQGLIQVTDSKTEAGVREVVIPSFLATQLNAVRWEGFFPTGLVFRTKDGKPLSKRNTLRALKSAAEAAGIEHVTQHELRHTYASILISGGMDCTLVADQMGHANPAMTLKVYAKLFNPASRRDALREYLQETYA